MLNVSMIPTKARRRKKKSNNIEDICKGLSISHSHRNTHTQPGKLATTLEILLSHSTGLKVVSGL